NRGTEAGHRQSDSGLLTGFRGAENVIDIRPLLGLQIEIKSIQPLFQIIQIKISELQDSVRGPDPQRRRARSQRRLTDKVTPRLQHARDFADSLILIPK